MQSKPVYCGLMVITEAFDWAMFFAGQTYTAGSESGETYTKQMLAVSKPYGVIEKMEETGVVVGTDGCSSITTYGLSTASTCLVYVSLLSNPAVSV